MTTTLEHTCVIISDEELADLLASSDSARLDSPAGPLPLVEVTAETTIDGLIATTRYTQRFINPTDAHLEVSYIFPLPSRAGVTDFVATLGGRRIEGILKERGQARADYAQAMAESKRAALVEAERPDVFTAKIGNIAPNEEAVIELVVTGPLVVEDGEATFRFPLVTAPRYITGDPLGVDPAGTGTAPDTDAVPDASRLNPPRMADNQPRPKLNFSVDLSYPGLDCGTLRTSHDMAVETGAKKGTAALALNEGSKMDSDLLVRFTLPKELTVSAVIRDDATKAKKGATVAKEKVGTWALTVVAPRLDSAIPRDVVIVLDRSGSMGGWKMVAARRAAARLIDSLSAIDRFAVVTFDNYMEVFSPDALEKGIEDLTTRQGAIRMLPGTDRNRYAAASWLAGCEARGGTEMRQPLTAAVDLLSSTTPDREPVVVLVTDGQIGAEAHLLASLEFRIGRTRFCVVGIDRAPNTSLLERISKRTNGYVTFVESEDRLDDALRNLHRRVGRPDLLSVRIAAENAEIIVEDTAPGKLADVFAGVPCVITGRYRRTGAKLPVLSIVAEKADGSGIFKESVTAKKSEARGITDTWARARVADLEDDYDAQRGDRGVLRSKIIELSIATHILTRFTAFVAVDHEAQEISSTHEMTQPVENPDGWSTSGTSFIGAVASYAGADMGLLRGGSMTSLSATSSIGMAPTSHIRRARSKGLIGSMRPTGPTLVGAGIPRIVTAPKDAAALVDLFEECLVRLNKATMKSPANIPPLLQRLSRIRATEPRLLGAIVTLNVYVAVLVSGDDVAKQKALDAAIKAVEYALTVLRGSAPVQGSVQFPDPSLGSYVASKTGDREFWS
jgi:Mg-chelatase subunit ChlD